MSRSYKKWRVCPVELELAVRRIRWAQSVVEHPEEHAHIIALLWGHADVDSNDRALDTVGRPTEEAPSLAWRIQMDFDVLEIMCVADGFVEEWTRCEKSWVQLFNSEELRARLRYVGVVELRTAFLLAGLAFVGRHT